MKIKKITVRYSTTLLALAVSLFGTGIGIVSLIQDYLSRRDSYDDMQEKLRLLKSLLPEVTLPQGEATPPLVHPIYFLQLALTFILAIISYRLYKKLQTKKKGKKHSLTKKQLLLVTLLMIATYLSPLISLFFLNS